MDIVGKQIEYCNRQRSNNYIYRLQDKIEFLEQEKQIASDKINDFLTYLCSQKFSIDTTIQVNEVVNRLLQIRLDLA